MSLKSFPKLVFASSTIQDGNMTFIRGDKNQTLHNRQKFLDQFNINDKNFIALSLVHQSDIKIVQDKDLNHGILDGEYYLECDGLTTNKKGVYLFMVTADCLPIAFFDPKTLAVALIHASRHNLLTGIVKNSIQKLTKEFNANPQDLLIKIGPSIGPCCYNTDKTKVKRFTNPQIQPYIIETETKLGLNLWQWIEDELIKNQISKTHINNPKICTYHTNRYFSHVKFTNENLQNDYRFATILGIKNVN